MDCVFCAIINGDIPSKTVYEDDMIKAFYDIEPQAPVHIIIIPKLHIASANEIGEDEAKYVAHIFAKIPQIAKEAGIAENGYRIINNCGKDGGQTVGHLHFHLLGGRDLGAKLV
ncbi:MAG: histidine triad nucleotide-binding protein [Eubacteriales bacterium]|nr:histidine triad nucleotide-binding protein [Eubacteriales bacterium]